MHNYGSQESEELKLLTCQFWDYIFFAGKVSEADKSKFVWWIYEMHIWHNWILSFVIIFNYGSTIVIHKARGFVTVFGMARMEKLCAFEVVQISILFRFFWRLFLGYFTLTWLLLCFLLCGCLLSSGLSLSSNLLGLGGLNSSGINLLAGNLLVGNLLDGGSSVNLNHGWIETLWCLKKCYILYLSNWWIS